MQRLAFAPKVSPCHGQYVGCAAEEGGRADGLMETHCRYQEPLVTAAFSPRLGRQVQQNMRFWMCLSFADPQSSSSNCCQPATTSQGGVAFHKPQIPRHSKHVLPAFVDLLLNSSPLRIMNTMPWSLVPVAQDCEQRLVWLRQDSIRLVYQNCFLREVTRSPRRVA